MDTRFANLSDICNCHSMSATAILSLLKFQWNSETPILSGVAKLLPSHVCSLSSIQIWGAGDHRISNRNSTQKQQLVNVVDPCQKLGVEISPPLYVSNSILLTSPNQVYACNPIQDKQKRLTGWTVGWIFEEFSKQWNGFTGLFLHWILKLSVPQGLERKTDFLIFFYEWHLDTMDTFDTPIALIAVSYCEKDEGIAINQKTEAQRGS